jgi:glycine hydroxymethyltransferase
VYASQVISNAQRLTSALAERGLRPVTGGTDTHLALLDLQGAGVSGKDAETRAGAAGIVLNKNAIPNDPAPPSIASGIRVGSPSVTTQGMGPDQMEQIAEFIHQAVTTDSPTVHAEVRRGVSELVAAFPAYPNPRG